MHHSVFFGCHPSEIRSSAGREPRDSVEAPVEAVTAVRVVASASHVIELLDAGHHSVRVKANVPVVGGRHRRLALNDGSDAVGG